MSLVVSWIVAVLFTPLLGVTLLPDDMNGHHETGKGWFAAGFERACSLLCDGRTAGSRSSRRIGAFALAVVGMGFVQQQFFPSSDRPELIVDWNLPQNASIADTNAQMARFEREMLADDQDVDHWSTYVGQGAPRFVLSFDVQPTNIAFGQT